VGLNIVASTVLFAAKAPDSMISSLSIGQKLLWLCIFAPLAEELFMRGWFQSTYLRVAGPAGATSAIVMSATLFAAMHVFVSTSWSRIIVTVVTAFLSELIYRRVRQASGSLLPAVVMHSVFNASGWLVAKPLWSLISRVHAP
jgi:membrane protease YdiL (CAAX protease family)